MKQCQRDFIVASYYLQGLNPLMFMFAVLGNSTYVARYPASLYYLLYLKFQHQSDFCQLKVLRVRNYQNIFNEHLVCLLMPVYL